MPPRTLATILGVAALAAAAPAQRPADAPSGPTFISPMGEPFRGTVGGVTAAARWFAQADRDHDGHLSITEMRLDAQRFFKTLDLDHDGEIDPAEIEKYETVVAPEIASLMSASGNRVYATEEDGPSGEPTAKDTNGYPIMKGDTKRPRMGGGRHRRDEVPQGYLGLTEPVSAADRNFNRGVSAAEFDAAAQARFHQLDTANQGYLTAEELKPQLR